MAKVKGKLFAACYVGGKLRQAGEEVEVDKSVAESFFGTPEQLAAREAEKAEAEAKTKAEKAKP